MKDLPRLLCFLSAAGALLFVSCRPVSPVNAVLNDVEGYVNAAPDSARDVLRALDTTALRTRRLKARYALLRTMALDKCYADITKPGLLDPDADWLARHGTPDEKLKLWFYRGRILSDAGKVNEAAVALSRAETYVVQAKDQHAVGLLYLSFQGIYNYALNRAKEQEYSEKAIEVFRRTDDPLAGPALGRLALAYYNQRKWDLADSVFRDAQPYFESLPALAPSYLSNYAEMKVLQPQPDAAGAIALLDRYWELTGSFGTGEAGVYAYAQELVRNRKAADAWIPFLRTVAGGDRPTALVWLSRIDLLQGNYQSAYGEQAELHQYETQLVQGKLEDSVTQALREDAARQAEEARRDRRQAMTVAFFAVLTLILLSLLYKTRLKGERDRLFDLREQMQEELEKAQSENAEKAQLISGQEDRIREMEELVAKERDAFTRDRLNRLRQLGELRSTFWWRERGGMREADAIRRIKKEFSYVFQTGKDGAALVRHLDEELNGSVSRLRDALLLGDRPKEVLFLCCCILDLEPEMIAEIMDTSKANVYEKRSRLRARVRALNDPLLAVLVGKS